MQPDGRERVVSYSADDEQGFVANVSYTNPDGGYVVENRLVFYTTINGLNQFFTSF